MSGTGRGQTKLATNQMLELYDKAIKRRLRYDTFIQTVVDFAYSEMSETEGKEAAEARFHRFRHDLKKKKITIPMLAGTPQLRLSTEEILNNYDWAQSTEEAASA